MIIDLHYILLLLILLFLAFSKGNREKKFIWAVWITFLFLGLRACVVGADTYNYTRGFLGQNFYKGEDIEPLYNILYVRTLSMILQKKEFFILANTFFSLFPLYLLIKKYSLNKSLSILWFFIFDIYYSYFVALRQILAISILILGVIYLNESRRYKWPVFTLCSLIAYGFHTSSLIASFIFLIVYFVKIESRKNILILIIASALFGIILQAFQFQEIFNLYLSMNSDLTTDRLNEYMINAEHILNVSQTSGYIYLLRYSWLGLFIFYFIDEERLNHWFSKVFLCSIILYNLFYNVDMIARINLSFYLMSIVVITWAFGDRYNLKIKRHKIFKIIPFLVFLWFVQAYIRSHINYDLNNADRMHPYYFFWEDYHTHPSITRF